MGYRHSQSGHITHKSLDPRTTGSISLPESLWLWLEDHVEVGSNKSRLIEQGIRLLMEAEGNDA